MKILMLVLMFFIIGGLVVTENNDLPLHKGENVERFYEMYIEWTGNVYSGILVVTGEVVRQNWLPE